MGIRITGADVSIDGTRGDVPELDDSGATNLSVTRWAYSDLTGPEWGTDDAAIDVTLTVIDATDSPVENALVEYNASSARTDSEGVVEFESRPARHDITIRAPGFNRLQTTLDIPYSEESYEETLTLEFAPFSRQIVSPGSPIDGADVTVEPHDPSILDDHDYTESDLTRVTGDWEDDRGVAVWDDLPQGMWDIHVFHPDYLEATYEDLDLDPSGRQPIIYLEADPRERFEITVRVIDEDGSPIRGAEVTIWRDTRTTGSAGRTSWELPEGTFTVEVSADGYFTSTVDIDIDASVEGETFDIELEAIDTDALVYDVQAPPLRHFCVGYWPLDGHGDDLINDVTADTSGEWDPDGIDERSIALDISGSSSDGARVENLWDEIEFDGFGTWTIATWARPVSTSGPQTIISLGGGSSTYVGLGINSSGNVTVHSSDASGSGPSFPSGTSWRHVALSWDGDDFHTYVDGEHRHSVSLSGTRSWLRTLDTLAVGRRPHTTTAAFGGAIDQALLFDAALSEEQIDALASIQGSTLTPQSLATQSDAQVSLRADADIPLGGEIEIEAIENTGSGTHRETITLSDGEQYVPLSLPGESGSSYRLRTEVSTSITGQTPLIRRRALDVPSDDILDLLKMRHPTEDDTILDIPIHDPETVSPAPFRARRESDEDIGAVRLVDPEGVPLRTRNPRTGEIYGVEFFVEGEFDEEEVDPPNGDNGTGEPDLGDDEDATPEDGSGDSEAE